VKCIVVINVHVSKNVLLPLSRKHMEIFGVYWKRVNRTINFPINERWHTNIQYPVKKPSIINQRRIANFVQNYWISKSSYPIGVENADGWPQRVTASQKFPERNMLRRGDLLSSIVTGDELWVYHFTLETKTRQSLECGRSDSPKKWQQVRHGWQEKPRSNGLLRPGKVFYLLISCVRGPQF